VQLKVTVHSWGEEGLDIEQTLSSFEDAEKIGVQVGRAVRDFLRHVPMTRNGAHTQIDVRAGYVEREPREPAKRKGRKSKAAAAAEEE
jgi:hypothetical protein